MRVLLLNLGFIHQKNLSAFRAMCKYTSATLTESSKVDEVLDKEWDLVWIPFGYIPPRRFSEKTKRIILGPHNFVLPEPPWTIVVFQDSRASYNCLSRWNRDAYIKAGGVADLSLVLFQRNAVCINVQKILAGLRQDFLLCSGLAHPI